MAHPKHKISKARRDKRRSHQAISEVTLSTCQNCGATHERHKVCPECGYYRGRQVMNVNN